MKKFKLLLSILIGFNSVFAQNSSISTNWSVVEGLYGGKVNDIAIHPTNENIVWISTVNGIYKTINGGDSWLLKNNGLPDEEISNIAIDKNNPDVLFVMTSWMWTETGGTYKTTDGGENWMLVKPNLCNWGRFKLAVNPSNSNIIYAVSDGLYRSDDGGDTWNKIKNSATCIFIDPSNNNTIFIIDNWTEIYKSTDGINWDDITNNLSSLTNSLHQIVIDPTNSDIMYAPSNEGVYKTTNGGEIWFLTGLHNTTSPICIDKNSPNTLYAPAEFGLYKTENAGVSWDKIREVGRANIIEISDNSASLFSGVENGTLEKSITAGSTWEVKQSGIIGYRTSSIHFSPANNNGIFVGTNQAGLFLSLDNGATWENSSVWDNGVTYASPSYPNSIITDPSDENIIYVCFGSKSILRSVNGGISWNWIMHDGNSNGNTSLLVDYINTSTIYVSNVQNGIYKTINNGDIWEQINDGLFALDVRLLVMHPSNNEIIYAATYGAGIFKTVDAGATWTSASTGLTNWNISSLAINQDNPSIIYAGTIDGTGSFFKTINGGENWTLSNMGLPADADVQHIVIDPDDSDIIYLSTQYNAIFISPNAGHSWKTASFNLPNQNILCLGKHSETLYAGSNSKGLLRSTIFLIKNTEKINITCVGDNNGSITVNVYGGTSPYQYSINNGAIFQASNQFTDLASGEYQIVVKDANETIVSWDETIVLTEPLTVNLGENIADCNGQVVTLDAGVFATYLWNDESAEQTLEITTSGTYSVLVTDENGCVSTDEIVVTLNPLPTASFAYELNGVTATFTNSSEYADSFQWNFGDDNTSTETNPVHAYASAGNYQVELTSLSNVCGVATNIQTITLTTSIDDEEFSKLVTFYPNPANGWLSLKIDDSVTGEIHIEITAVNGQMIHTKKFSSPNEIQHIDLSNHAKGVYIIQIIANELIKTGKLIIE